MKVKGVEGLVGDALEPNSVPKRKMGREEDFTWWWSYPVSEDTGGRSADSSTLMGICEWCSWGWCAYEGFG